MKTFRWLLGSLLVLLGLAGLGILSFTVGSNPAGSPVATRHSAPSSARAGSGSPPQATGRATGDAEVNAAFHQWAAEYAAAPAVGDPEQRLAKGLALGKSRRARLERLIRENPAQAIAESLSFSEWAALPAAIRAVVERPFSITSDYHYYPVCAPEGVATPPHTPDHIADIDMGDGRSPAAYVYGKNAGLMSKRGLPMQGIELGSQAALRDGSCQPLSDQDLAVARTMFPLGQHDATLSYVTGQPVGAGAVFAVVGGKIQVFADAAQLAQFDARLTRLNSRPGPVAASTFLAMPDGISSGGAVNWGGLDAYASAQASAWTETQKTLFLIRANFTDKLAEPVTQAAATSEINGPSSAMILAMSYGKTWVEGSVSANVYTLPQSSAYYYNSGTGLNSELIRDARNTFRTSKIGGDAAVNIGPVSTNTNGDGGGLGNYDIVAVFFTSIGMSSGGITYAGLAGGGNLWVQNANYTSLYTHEWGHNYGLAHASSWDTTNGSVIGAGTSAEYGDVFDVMGSGPAPQGHYHPQGKVKLNWLTTAQWTDASAAGSNTYRVYREDDPATTGAPRGVRVTKSAIPGSEEYYWIGYKPAFTTNPHLLRGAYLTWQQAGQSKCWLLDTTPNSPDGKNDAPVDLGRTYADTAANVFITPLAVGGSGANPYLDVRVNLGPYPANHAPTAGAITGPATVVARTSAGFAIAASDADADPLAYSWNTQDGAANDDSSSITHSWRVGGTHAIGATVSDMKGGTLTVNKSVTVTDPIDTWTPQSVGSTDSLQDVVWGKGRFVAAEYWGSVYTSWDGVAWTNVGGPPAFDNQPRLAFGNTVFVMAGKKDNLAAAQICYSADGRIWAAASFPAGIPPIQELAFGNGKFLAVADGGTVLASADGITWALTSVAGSPNFRHVTWDGLVWAAVAMNAAQSRPEVVWTSLDGASWSQGNALGFDTYRIYGLGGTLYALGWYGGVTYSTDHGQTWTSAATPGTTRWSTFRMAVSDEGTFLATARAMDESGTPNALLVSTDGIHWSRSTANSGNPAVGAANGLAFGGGRFVTVEAAGIVRTCNSFYPSNAAPVPSFTVNPSSTPARQVVVLSASATDANGDPLVYAWDYGSQFPILDGATITPRFDFGGSYAVTLRVSDSHGGLATLSYSITVTDPVRTFSQRASGTTSNLNAIAANATTAVAVGGSGGIIRTSTDGITWTSRSITEYAGNLTFRGATWDGGKFIIVGSDYNFTATAGWQGVIYTSPDGITWTRRYGTTGRGDELQAVASDGAGAVAVGTNGTVLASANGTAWSPVTIAGLSASTLSGIAWNGGTYAFVGYAGSNGGAKVFTSADRSNWIDCSAGAGVASWQDLRKIAWLNNRFVASGWYSSLRTSSDNAQTFTTTRGVTEEAPAMAYGDGIWFAAGVNHSSSDAAVDLMSLDGASWYSFAAPTTTNLNGAVFFKHTLITVGDGGSIWQSGNTTSLVPYTYTTAGGAVTLTGYTGSGGVVTIPGTLGGLPVTGITSNAFYNCAGLTSVTVPAGVASIASSAFANCPVLASVYFKGNAPNPATDTSVFAGDSIATIYHVAGATGWGSTFDGRPTALFYLLDYALGRASADAKPAAGVLAGGVLTFTKGGAAIANGDVIFVIESSSDLVTWAAAVTQSAPNASPTIAYTLPAGPARRYARLKVVQVP